MISDWPKSPRQDAARPAPVLREQRIVEAELELERRDLLGRRELPEDQVRDVAGQDLRDDEDQPGDDDQDDADRRYPLCNVEPQTRMACYRGWSKMAPRNSAIIVVVSSDVWP